MHGYHGRLLRINLSEQQYKTEEISPDFTRKYLGGVGFGARILYDELASDTDPLGPDNKMVMAPGLLLSSKLPTASKTSFVFKSPLTGGFGRAVAGAWIGDSLKKASYDFLIIEGASVEPVLIKIEDDQVEFEDARDLWGKDIPTTRKEIASRYKETFRTAVIGPAGEKLSKISIVDCDNRQAGRAGCGAVFGSKKLKGIITRGTGEVPIADPEGLEELVEKWRKLVREHSATEADMNYGTGEFLDWMNREPGTFPSKNWQWGYFQSAYEKLGEDEKIELDPYYWAPKYVERNFACPYCIKPCGKIFKIKSGKYQGTEIDGPEYETLYSLGGCPAIESIEAVAKANQVCDRLGLDTISAGVTVAWAMEAYEKGLLKNTEGIELNFGSEDALIETLEKMGHKEGNLGELLINGSKEAAKKLGKGGEFAINIKGMELPAYDIRGATGVALAFAVGVRGGDHLTAGNYGTEYGGSWWQFENVDRFSTEGKGFEVKIHEDLMTLYDITGMCKFTRHMVYAEGFPAMINTVTGRDLSTGEYLTIGERVYNIARAFNAREGFGRANDHLPWRVMNEPIPAGPSKGSKITKEQLDKMLDDYYQARGWNKEGIPLKVKLVSLDLPEAAEEVGAGE